MAAGERRRGSLKALAKDKKIPGNFPVPCIVRPEEEAVELSLAENIIRVAMHPLDQFAAFAALIDKGKSVEDVAARFGITPGIVTRRMKLARVSPVILEAFREQKITLEAVMGFTVSDDHAEQGRVYAEIVSRGGSFTRQYIVMMSHADQLAETLRLDMSKYWTPTAGSFFGRVSKKAICVAVAEAAGEGIAFRIQDLKKSVMAAEAENIAAKTGWLPVVLRTRGLPAVNTAPEALAAE